MAIAMNEDPANVRMDLQTALLKDGYSIVSTAGNENAENILNFSYNYYYDDAGNVFLNGFWVEITKRQTGTVIMSISYPSGNFKKTLIIRNFLKRFNLCVKENICDEKNYDIRRQLFHPQGRDPVGLCPLLLHRRQKRKGAGYRHAPRGDLVGSPYEGDGC